MKILILGGIKSGKSAFALKLASQFSEPRIFLATAQAFDEEMAKKIERHRRERGHAWHTIEAPIELPEALKEISSGGVVLIDCLTVWLGNLFYHQKDVDFYVEALVKNIESFSFPLVIVSNEVGLAPVPADKETRKFAETLGLLNQKIARLCNHTYFMIAGKALIAK
ncbi:Adenosylcobinamide-phosphateguanylyltransferase [Thermodesulfatator indicus DSM 15286]|uniref:Adenosylcobinamide kinase n=1 Tax=Thermodesulfatator indicus (strain DSM 15286 / JCM 11887 / CIR29812) TaxID=667014 RepID=F8AA12_THEID|nr:bifunctional adenosylcobinamide kinase/adenosylcobinamide-phosphate guanylyltransferase [Thermodesulfatator indicus]AEH45298.1 Adenosylcobinamide-phosphateguanylyltransferase [Thermodesulfatator indicus DSM 15286]